MTLAVTDYLRSETELERVARKPRTNRTGPTASPLVLGCHSNFGEGFTSTGTLLVNVDDAVAVAVAAQY